MTSQTIVVQQDIRETRRQASAAFQRELASRGTLIVRLLSSPGAGKTSLLEKTAAALANQFSLGVLVGDVETDRDARRLAPFAPSIQITTGGACHLELELVKKALPKLGAATFDFLFIEDVGNLICPASHELGEHVRVIVLSTTEGDDKPGKYPKAFRTSQVVVFNKTDLLPYVPFSIANAEADAQRVQPELRFFNTSALRNEGIQAWCDFLIDERNRMLAQVATLDRTRPQ